MKCSSWTNILNKIVLWIIFLVVNLIQFRVFHVQMSQCGGGGLKISKFEFSIKSFKRLERISLSSCLLYPILIFSILLDRWAGTSFTLRWRFKVGRETCARLACELAVHCGHENEIPLHFAWEADDPQFWHRIISQLPDLSKWLRPSGQSHFGASHLLYWKSNDS